MDTSALQGFLTRLSIFVVGVGSGSILVIPVGMGTGPGTRRAVTLSYIGLLGCLFLIIGGIFGAMTKQWIALVPGTVIFLILFTPSVPPLAVVAIFLIYCCYINPK